MKTRKNHINESDLLQISEGVSIHGSIKAEGDVIIEGELNGGIRSSGKIRIGSSGKIIGNIVSGVTEINGVVKGDIYAGNKVFVSTSATVLGDIYTNELVIEKGAFFQGECKMIHTHSNSSETSAMNEVQSLTANT